MKWHSHSLHQDQYHQPFCTIVVWWFLLSLSQPAVVEEMMEENQESSGAPRRLAKHMKLNRTRKKPVAMGTKVRWEDKIAWWAFHSTQKSNTPSASQHFRVRDNWLQLDVCCNKLSQGKKRPRKPQIYHATLNKGTSTSSYRSSQVEYIILMNKYHIHSCAKKCGPGIKKNYWQPESTLDSKIRKFNTT